MRLSTDALTPRTGIVIVTALALLATACGGSSGTDGATAEGTVASK